MDSETQSPKIVRTLFYNYRVTDNKTDTVQYFKTLKHLCETMNLHRTTVHYHFSGKLKSNRAAKYDFLTFERCHVPFANVVETIEPVPMPD